VLESLLEVLRLSGAAISDRRKYREFTSLGWTASADPIRRSFHIKPDSSRIMCSKRSVVDVYVNDISEEADFHAAEKELVPGHRSVLALLGWSTKTIGHAYLDAEIERQSIGG